MNKKYKINRLLFVVILIISITTINLYARINYKSITGINKISNDRKEFDTVSKEISQQLAIESYGIIDKEINPEKYIVGAGDEFTIVFESSVINKLNSGKIRIRVLPDGYLLIDGVGGIYIAGKNLTEAYKLINEKMGQVYKNFSIALSDVRKFKVNISGAAIKSSVVPATATDRVSEIIERVGGLQDSASVRNIILIRAVTNERLKVDLLKFYLLADNESNPYVNGGDHIIVPFASEKQIISIQGDVPAPCEVEFLEGDSLSTLIRFGLGFFESALLDSVEYVQWTSSGLITNILDLSSWKNIITSKENPSNDFALNSGDRVYVRTKADWQKIHYAIITGEVKYPGKYSIEKDVDKVGDLIRRAGGFTKDADVTNIEFIRQEELQKKDLEMERLYRTIPSEMSKSEFRYFQSRVREKKGGMSIDFEKIVLDETSEDNITLISQDSIIVPAKTNFINVQGKVVNPGFVKYRSDFTYIDYINAAGGFAYRADESETTVNKRRGGEQFLASKTSKYKLEPGDNISVPPKTEIEIMDIITTILTIVSPIVSMIAVIIAIK